MEEMEPIEKGTLLMFSTGEYSDYYVMGVFRALERIDPKAMRDEWCQLYPKEAERYHFSEDKFLGWLYRKGLLAPLDCTQWHLGAYACADMWTKNLDNDTEDT